MAGMTLAALLLALVAETPWPYDFLGPDLTLPDGRTVNASVHYWNDVVGVPFARDAELLIPPTPLDLDLDGRADTVFSGRWALPGGLLGSPQLVGLAPTLDDPAGTVGAYSVSTGYLGVREELDPVTRRGTGRYGFNCWLCHGSADGTGRVVLGRPNANIHLGLIMATSAALDPDHVLRETPASAPMTPLEVRVRTGLDASFALDPNGDAQVTVAEWRAAMNLPDADTTRAMLMLAGPGRLDQSVDERLGRSVPLALHHHYMLGKIGSEAHVRYARIPKRAMFNPVSIPQNLSGLGVAHYSWTGKDSSMRHDAVATVTKELGVTPDTLAEWIRFPHAGARVDYEALSRALTLDFRNVGTMALEADNPDGQDWAYEVNTHPTEALMTGYVERFRAHDLRDLLTGGAGIGEQGAGSGEQEAGGLVDPLVAEGRRIFLERVVGEVLNQRVVLGRESNAPQDLREVPVLVPLDRSRPASARVPVRCGTCHNYSPLAAEVPLTAPLADVQRCDLCHFDHPQAKGSDTFVALAEHMQREGLAAAEDCLRCHATHPHFGPQAWSNSWLLPFDADGDGRTFGDEAEDAAAGGIGTDAQLNVDSLFTVQLQRRRPQKMYLLSDNAAAPIQRVRSSSAGHGWVRVAPLLLIGRTGPYLHNGSVPTLEALLADPAARPQQFSVGLPAQQFLYDTALPGNRNGGHEFGADLTEHERAALVRFLESL